MDGTEDVQYVFEKKQTFVLAHVEDADIKSRTGICLDTGRQEWLTEFKKAIEQCADSGSRSKLEGRAFSNTALGGQVTSHGSALANCEAANQRAEAVVEFLLGRPRKRWACGSGRLPRYCGECARDVVIEGGGAVGDGGDLGVGKERGMTRGWVAWGVFLLAVGWLSSVAVPGAGQARMEAGTVFRDCAGCPEMVIVPAGTYMMGRRREHTRCRSIG